MYNTYRQESEQNNPILHLVLQLTLLSMASKTNQRIVSMGAGGKTWPKPKIRVADLYDTMVCKLAFI